MSKKMFAAVYGDEADVRALLGADVQIGHILIAAELIEPDAFNSAEKAKLYGTSAGLAVHRAVKDA